MLVYSFLLFIWYFVDLLGASSVRIFRSSCRNDALFKVSKKDMILTGSSSTYLLSSHKVVNASLCAKYCINATKCESFNYKRWLPSLEQENNCQILQIGAQNSSAIYVNHTGWNHYQPVEQLGPGCRLDKCGPGFICLESCTELQRYVCQDINECESNPCKNGATCNNKVNSYDCSCVSGYIGVQCETERNECASNPCSNGGTCTDHLNRFSCTCASGYTGSRCQYGRSDSSHSGSSGSITSPNYPMSYGNYYTRTWTITVSAGKRVRLYFGFFDTESCCDKVTLRSGSSSGSIITTLAGTSANGQAYYSSGNVMYVYFRTDGSVTRKGFSASWSET